MSYQARRGCFSSGRRDNTARRMMEGILAMEEEHADDLVSLLEELGN
jgi:bacterioferritin